MGAALDKYGAESVIKEFQRIFEEGVDNFVQGDWGEGRSVSSSASRSARRTSRRGGFSCTWTPPTTTPTLVSRVRGSRLSRPRAGRDSTSCCPSNFGLSDVC